MNLKTSLFLALACASALPSSLYAAPKKAAKPLVEYCLLTYRFNQSTLTVTRPDGSQSEEAAGTSNDPFGQGAIAKRLNALSRSGWRVAAFGVFSNNQIWTLERRK